MKSIYHQYVDLYKEDGNFIINIKINNAHLQNEAEFIEKLKPTKLPDYLISELILKYQRILDMFVFGNSYIGHEFYILKKTVFQIAIWNSIATKRGLNPIDLEICSNEIEVLFYNYMNIVYNIKEKVQHFCIFKKGKPKKKELENGKYVKIESILNTSAKTRIKKLLNDEYTNIRAICEGRNYLVHDSFGIRYNNKSKSVSFSALNFDLSKQCLYKKETYSNQYPINQTALLKTAESVARIINGILIILSDLRNIDAVSFYDKFEYKENNKKIFKITF